MKFARDIAAGSLGLLIILPLVAWGLVGCADPTRQVIGKPYLVDSPTPATIFGEATIGPQASKEAIANIKVPDLPHKGPLTLDECLELAQKVSPTIDTADQGQLGALWSRWQSITDFLPSVDLSYSVTHEGDKAVIPAHAGQKQYAFGTRITQPLFTGGANVTRYLLAQLGVAAADIAKTQAREDLLLAVKQAFFSILAAEKALAVAKATVVNITGQLQRTMSLFEEEKAAWYEVLEAQTELAKAQQAETTQSRTLLVNKANLNILLRRPVEFDVKVRDELKRYKFPLTLDFCLNIGLHDNPEILLARNQVEAGAKNVDVARSALYPQVQLTYSSNSVGDTGKASGGWSANSSSWDIAAVASFNIWEWGKTKAGVEISKVALNQAINSLTSLEDSVKLEIATNYQNLISAGLNIDVSVKAVESAAENLRMVNERFQTGMSPITDVLDSQARYSEAQYEHYQSLYNYNLAWAAIERSLGRRVPAQGLPDQPLRPGQPLSPVSLN
ncbi:MAG: TolC family protein [Deltaproteobacteria bacterium]|jgi:outer membrane protein TolC|nr:TolC family protein [Deltaproteobacteria bacterium]